MLGPPGLLGAIAEKIHADVSKVIQAQDIRERFQEAGLEARSLPYVQVAPHVRSEIAKWAQVVKASSAKSN